MPRIVPELASGLILGPCFPLAPRRCPGWDISSRAHMYRTDISQQRRILAAPSRDVSSSPKLLRDRNSHKAVFGATRPGISHSHFSLAHALNLSIIDSTPTRLAVVQFHDLRPGQCIMLGQEVGAGNLGARLDDPEN